MRDARYPLVILRSEATKDLLRVACARRSPIWSRARVARAPAPRGASLRMTIAPRLPRLTACTRGGKVASSHPSDWLPLRAPGGHRAVSEIIIHDDENFERALRRFKKKCEKAGILSDLRKHRHYEKPSERRKRKMNAAVRKNRRTRTA